MKSCLRELCTLTVTLTCRLLPFTHGGCYLQAAAGAQNDSLLELQALGPIYYQWGVLCFWALLMAHVVMLKRGVNSVVPAVYINAFGGPVASLDSTGERQMVYQHRSFLVFRCGCMDPLIVRRWRVLVSGPTACTGALRKLERHSSAK